MVNCISELKRVTAERLPLIYDGGTNKTVSVVITEAHIVIDEQAKLTIQPGKQTAADTNS